MGIGAGTGLKPLTRAASIQSGAAALESRRPTEKKRSHRLGKLLVKLCTVIMFGAIKHNKPNITHRFFSAFRVRLSLSIITPHRKLIGFLCVKAIKCASIKAAFKRPVSRAFCLAETL